MNHTIPQVLLSAAGPFIALRPFAGEGHSYASVGRGASAIEAWDGSFFYGEVYLGWGVSLLQDKRYFGWSGGRVPLLDERRNAPCPWGAGLDWGGGDLIPRGGWGEAIEAAHREAVRGSVFVQGERISPMHEEGVWARRAGVPLRFAGGSPLGPFLDERGVAVDAECRRLGLA